MGSIADTTSPFWGRKADGSILSPGDVSIKTASSMWVGGERDTAGSWEEYEHKENGEGNEKWNDEDDNRDEWEEAQEEEQEEEEEGEEQSDHSGRRFGLLDEAEKMPPSPEDDARERGPATRYREKQNCTCRRQEYRFQVLVSPCRI